jgi:hypothetical protein
VRRAALVWLAVIALFLGAELFAQSSHAASQSDRYVLIVVVHSDPERRGVITDDGDKPRIWTQQECSDALVPLVNKIIKDSPKDRPDFTVICAKAASVGL